PVASNTKRASVRTPLGSTDAFRPAESSPTAEKEVEVMSGGPAAWAGLAVSETASARVAVRPARRRISGWLPWLSMALPRCLALLLLLLLAVLLLGAALFVLALLLLRLAALGRRVAGAAEARRGRVGGWRCASRLAAFAFAGRLGDRVLGGEAASAPGVVDVDQQVGVGADQLLAGEEEDVVAGGRGVGEEGGFAALAARDQVEAALVQGAVGGAARFAAAGSRRLPLIDVVAGGVGL